MRINVLSASNLKAADFSLISANKSDPYVRISGIGIPAQTQVISSNLNPVWNESFDFLIDEIDINPNILIEVYDRDEKNFLSGDDFLGG